MPHFIWRQTPHNRFFSSRHSTTKSDFKKSPSSWKFTLLDKPFGNHVVSTIPHPKCVDVLNSPSTSLCLVGQEILPRSFTFDQIRLPFLPANGIWNFGLRRHLGKNYRAPIRIPKPSLSYFDEFFMRQSVNQLLHVVFLLRSASYDLDN